MKTFGVLGGLGPMATSYLLQRIVEMTEAENDQDHADIIVFSRPTIPDRTAYILNSNKPSPIPALIDTAKLLVHLGVCAIGIPCVTAHGFYSEIQNAIDVPIVNMVKETAQQIKKEGRKKAGILATSGTIYTGIFQSALSEAGLEWEIPKQTIQLDIMRLIYGYIKAGKPVDMKMFKAISDSFHEMGCDVLILGCTELSTIKRKNDIGHGYIDVIDVMAKAAVLAVGKKLRSEFKILIS